MCINFSRWTTDTAETAEKERPSSMEVYEETSTDSEAVSWIDCAAVVVTDGFGSFV